MPKETQALIALGISKFNYHLAFFTKYGYPSKAACPWSVTPFRTHFLQGKAKKCWTYVLYFHLLLLDKFCPFFLSRVPITAKRFRRLRTISTMCIKETRKILIELGIQLIYFFEVNFMTNFGFKILDLPWFLTSLTFSISNFKDKRFYIYLYTFMKKLSNILSRSIQSTIKMINWTYVFFVGLTCLMSLRWIWYPTETCYELLTNISLIDKRAEDGDD